MGAPERTALDQAYFDAYEDMSTHALSACAPPPPPPPPLPLS